MTSPVISPKPEDLQTMIMMQKGFENMAGKVGIAERKMAALSGSFKSMPIVKAVSQLNNWRKSMSKTIGISTDWRNMSKEEKEEMKGKMTIMQKMIVPLLAYSKVGSMNNKMMAKHNNLLTRISTKFLAMFAILGLIIMVFAAVSIAIDGANSPIVEMTDGIAGLEQIVGGLVLVFSGEDGEGGLAGAVNLAVMGFVVFGVVALVFGTTAAFIVTSVMLVVGVFNLVKNATGSVEIALMAAIATASVLIGGFVVFMGWATSTAVATVVAPFALVLITAALFWAVVTGKAPGWMAWIVGILAAITVIVIAWAFGITIGLPVLLIAAAVGLFVALVALIWRNWDKIKAKVRGVGVWLKTEGKDFAVKVGKGAIWLITLPARLFIKLLLAIGKGLGSLWKKAKKWGKGSKDKMVNGIKAGVAYIVGTPKRVWNGFKQGLAGAAIKFIKWYNKNIANFLKFKVPKWVPKIGGKKVGIPPKIKVPMLAEGGIVNSPTLAMIGEKGPEAVVPLGKGGHGMGNTFNIKIDVSGVTDRSDKRQLAMQISNEIQKEMRRYGSTTSRRAI